MYEQFFDTAIVFFWGVLAGVLVTGFILKRKFQKFLKSKGIDFPKKL